MNFREYLYENRRGLVQEPVSISFDISPDNLSVQVNISFEHIHNKNRTGRTYSVYIEKHRVLNIFKKYLVHDKLTHLDLSVAEFNNLKSNNKELEK